MVSTASGTGVETDETEETGRSQADMVKRMLSKGMNLRATFFFIENCMEYHSTIIVTDTLHKVVFFFESTQVDV